MDEDFIMFVVLITLIAGGFFLIFTKMVLNFFRDRRKSTDASVGTSELEAMIQRAVEAGTLALHDRLDDLEQRVEGVQDTVEAQPRALPEARPSALFEEVVEPVEQASEAGTKK